MDIEKQITIEFFKNGSAERVLERFEFSEEEKKLIQDAIRTANRTNPRMKLIYEADALLKEVAKTRKPVSPKKSSEMSPEVLANLELLNYKVAQQQQEKRSEYENRRSFFGVKSKYGIIIIIAISLGMIALQYYQKILIEQQIENIKPF